MAELDFLNHNDFCAYPLLAGQDLALSEPVWPPPDGPWAESSDGSSETPPCSTIRLPRRGLADAGFILGPLAEFHAGSHSVHLYSVSTGPDGIEFDFRSNATGMEGRRWLLSFDADAGFGCTARAGVTPVAGGGEEPAYGSAWATLGDPGELLALGTGWRALCAPAIVEPARIINLLGASVSSIRLANRARLCPPVCGQSQPSEDDLNKVWPVGAPLTGAVAFRTGFNGRIATDPARNALILDAVYGAGAGVPCSDLLADGSGVREDVDECQTCEGFVRSLNGRKPIGGALRVRAGVGVSADNDPTLKRVTIKTAVTETCD